MAETPHWDRRLQGGSSQRPNRQQKSEVKGDRSVAPPLARLTTTTRPNIVFYMKATFTALIDAAPEGGFWAVCPEIPGANGQGETVDEARNSLRDAIQLIMEDRIEDMRRGLDESVIQTVVSVG